MDELPSNLIVFATTSQLVDSISEALKVIKERYQKNRPNNITTLKHFQATEENKDDFLSYGRASKNVYLLAKLRKIIDAEHLKLFYDAHIMSHLNYASTISGMAVVKTHSTTLTDNTEEQLN